VLFSNRRAKWRREQKLRSQRRDIDTGNELDVAGFAVASRFNLPAPGGPGFNLSSCIIILAEPLDVLVTSVSSIDYCNALRMAKTLINFLAANNLCFALLYKNSYNKLNVHTIRIRRAGLSLWAAWSPPCLLQLAQGGCVNELLAEKSLIPICM